MSRVYNFDAKQDAIVFNIGNISLEFLPSDEQSKYIQEKGLEIQNKAKTLTDDSSESDFETAMKVKALLDELFETMFDAETPQKLYKEVGENTLSYLRVFYQISNAIREVNAERQNDEYFKQFLSE